MSDGVSRGADPRFFASSGPRSLAEIAARVGAAVLPDQAGRLLTGVAPLDGAQADQLSFCTDRKHGPSLAATGAGAVLVHRTLVGLVPTGTVALLVPNAHAAWARAVALFYPEPTLVPSIDPTAWIDPSATLGAELVIGPYVVIEAGAVIGDGCEIGAQAVIGRGCVLGRHCRIGVQVTVSHAILGDRVRIFPGARIGQDGFGFAVTESGFLSVPQIGRVLIEDEVEIGANTTIDRGSGADTVIGRGTRIDNLVQIGHNCRIGRFCILAGQAGLSGSVVMEDFAVLAGQAGVAQHVRIGARARIGPQTGVISDVPDGGRWLGSPAVSYRVYARQLGALRRLGREPGAGIQRPAATDEEAKP